MAFVLRRQQGTDRIRALLDLSTLSAPVTYVFLVLIIATGVALGIAGHWLTFVWTWVSLALLIVTSGVMVGLGMRYNTVRQAAGIPRGQREAETLAPPAPPEELQRAVAATQPMLIALVGVLALAALLWLMIMKPF